MGLPGQARQELEKRVEQFIADENGLLNLSQLGLLEIPVLENLFPHGSLLPSNINVLDISHNKLRRLPSWITRLSALKAIIASFNKIDELPASIGAVAGLEHLDLRNNKLWRLPDSLLSHP